METIGKKIWKFRRRKGLSQEELGNLIGVSRQIISRWELDAAVPNLKKMQRLCTVFDVPLSYFIDEESEVVAESVEAQPDTEVAAESIETQLDTETVAEISDEQPISEPVSEKTALQTKWKPWQPLVVAIVFTVLTFVPLFFCMITGDIAFSTNRGADMVANHNFDFWGFCVSLFFTILCFVFAVTCWILYISMKKARKNGN